MAAGSSRAAARAVRIEDAGGEEDGLEDGIDLLAEEGAGGGGGGEVVGGLGGFELELGVVAEDRKTFIR
jgi:hypothetical protein